MLSVNDDDDDDDGDDSGVVLLRFFVAQEEIVSCLPWHRLVAIPAPCSSSWSCLIHTYTYCAHTQFSVQCYTTVVKDTNRFQTIRQAKLFNDKTILGSFLVFLTSSSSLLLLRSSDLLLSQLLGSILSNELY